MLEAQARKLAALYDACRARDTAPAASPGQSCGRPAPPVLTRVTLHWSDGTATDCLPSFPAS